MWDAIKFFFALVIPTIDADPGKQFRWRLAIAALVVIILTGDTIHIALECGRLPFLFSGFASADALDHTNLTIGKMLKRDTERDIRTFEQEMCDAMAAKPENIVGRDFARNSLYNALQDWQDEDLNHQPHPALPSCDEVRSSVNP